MLEVGGSAKIEKAKMTSLKYNNWSIIDINAMYEPAYKEIYWMEHDDYKEEEEKYQEYFKKYKLNLS